MPVIKVNYEDLKALCGIKLTPEQLIQKLPMLGCDVESFDGENLFVEFFPNRPDLYSTEGVARALRSFLGKETGLKKYSLAKPRAALLVDKSVKGIRDYVAGCEVINVQLTNELIQELMELQEDLHWALGRDRKKVSIGVHDSSRVVPPYRYAVVKPEEIKFVPLGMSEELTLREILEKHPKGVRYAHIIKECGRYPVIFDSRNNVLSMPPIINGELTKLTEASTQLFVEITGTEFVLVSQALNILASAFAERGFEVAQVKVKYPNKTIVTPDFKPALKKLRVDYANQMLGLKLSPKEIAACLKKMGYGVRKQGRTLAIEVPCYRCDIMHEIDLVEDVAIGYGYENFLPLLPALSTTGEKHALEKFCEALRSVMLGYGFTEVMSLMLTNERNNFAKLRISGEAVVVKNPISEEHTILRTSLLQSLLQVLQINRRRELPHKIFELGDVLILDENFETGARTVRRLAACSAHSKASFTEIKSLVEGLLRDLGAKKYSIEKFEHGSFIPGRCAAVKLNGKLLVCFGELHPEVLANFELTYPVAAFEMEVEELIRN